jgi:hypothetical protein
MNEVALGQYFRFSCQLSFHRLLHTHLHLQSGTSTIGQLVADIPSGLSLTPSQEIRSNNYAFEVPIRPLLLLEFCVITRLLNIVHCPAFQTEHNISNIGPLSVHRCKKEWLGLALFEGPNSISVSPPFHLRPETDLVSRMCCHFRSTRRCIKFRHSVILTAFRVL